MMLTNLSNVVVEGVTIENCYGGMCHAEFLDDVYPDRTYGQHDRGILVVVYEDGMEIEYFVSYTDGSVWQGTNLIEGARCREVAVMAAVRDAKENYSYDYDAEGRLVIV